jgi:Druantia protein DruA/Transposase DNA-binding/Transposase Tn5 dimerisation domain
VEISRLRAVRVCGQEFSQETILRIRELINRKPGISRGALSREVCEWLEWRTKKGKLKQVNCRVALLRLHGRGEIELPAVKSFPGRRKRSCEAGSKKESRKPWKGQLEELEPIELIAVGSADSRASREWNEMMNRYHYLGAGPLCGAQKRYLVHSENYGYLGGLAFSAAAWRLESRDEWIGWDDPARRQNLNRVVANSRFLILPHVKVANLASHVLGIAARRIRSEWMERYGEDPVLIETFVERQRYRGTCYRAANWIEVGETKGRGRQDRNNRQDVPVKKVLLYALDPQARELLRRSEGAPEIAQAPSQRAEPGDWAEEEFGGAQLGDERLKQRLMTIARDFYANPQAQIPEACQSRAKTKAAYRFFGHPNTGMKDLLEPHYQATVQRIAKEKIVLSVQDTTSLNYSAHPLTNGIGPIGSRKEGAIGLIVHDTMALTPEGTPLGLVDVQCWARDPRSFGKHHQRKQKSIEQKESYKWLKSYQAAAQAQRQCPDTMIVSVGDREADIYELFQLALEDPHGPKLLVRAEQNRLLADGQGHLWPFIEKQPLAGAYELEMARRHNRPARQAQLEVRFAQVQLNPPRDKLHLKPLTLWAVLAQEMDPPEGVEAIGWMLLTTCPVSNFEQAMEKVTWYTRRWWIEVYHRTLKSGCKIEERQLGGACRIEACLAIDMVVAWRIFHLAKLGRETPDVPCTVFFEEAEWKALHAYVTKNPVPPSDPPTLKTAMHWVGMLGGYRGRKGDGDPGTQTLWRGMQHLDDLKEMWSFMAKNYAPQLFSPPVSRAPT